jgi:hypothetical protein
MLHSIGYLNNIVGCAYSNLFYPEIAFWSELRFDERALRFVIDQYRKRLTASADFWLFETTTLADRAVRKFAFPGDRVGVVPMTVSKLVSPQQVSSDTARMFDARLPPVGPRLLFLCGSQYNKRLHLLPGIAKALKANGMNTFTFVTTMAHRSQYCDRVKTGFIHEGVAQHLTNLGPVSPRDVASLISVCHMMCTFSRLESFSNNFVEAWRMEKPLVVTDADWARGCCGSAAAYLDPSDAMGAADVIQKLLIDQHEIQRLINEGAKMIRLHPDAAGKTELYWKYIQRATLLGARSCADRSRIRWQQ